MASVHRLVFDAYGSRDFPVAVVPAGPGAHHEHTHEFYELVYVRSGGGTNIIQGHPYPMLPGDLFLMRPEDVHSYGGGSTFGIVNVLFLPSLYHPTDWERLLSLPGLRDYLQPSATRAPHKVALVPADARAAETCCARLIHELRGPQRLPGADLLARNVITELLVIVSRALSNYGGLPSHEQRQEDNPIADAMTLMHNEFREPLTVAEIADAVGLSASWFGERFKATTGLSVIDYIVRLRVEAARTALEAGDTDITSIAFSVGFSDSSYFSRVFRAHTNMSPRTYRTMVRGGKVSRKR